MCRANQQSNSDRGHDMITLPDGKQAVVFTEKEFRIDQQGTTIKGATQWRNSSGGISSDGRGKGRGRMKGLLQYANTPYKVYLLFWRAEKTNKRNSFSY